MPPPLFKTGGNGSVVRTYAPVPEYNVDLRQKYSFSFLSNRIPNPRAVFHINGFRYVCEKISATLTENGVSRMMKFEGYRLTGSQNE